MKLVVTYANTSEIVPSRDREHLKPLQLRLVAETMRVCGVEAASALEWSEAYYSGNYDLKPAPHIPPAALEPNEHGWLGLKRVVGRHAGLIGVVLEKLSITDARFEYGPAGAEAEWAEFWNYVLSSPPTPPPVAAAEPPVVEAPKPKPVPVPYDALAECTPVLGVDYTVEDHKLVALTALGRHMKPYLATKLRQAGYMLVKS